MRGPSTPARREVLEGYLAFYRGQWAEGKVSPCHEPALKSQARRLLRGASGAPPLADEDEDDGASRPVLDVASIAERCLGKAAGGEGRPGLVLRNLGKAFEFLELLCVNLFLLPWRKEIKSLKTFTGNFVYYVQSVLPEELVTRLLEEIGYVPTNSTEFSLVKRLNEEDAEQAAFELFLARIECEELLEMAVDIRDSDLVDMLQKRAQKHWSPERYLARKHQSTQRKGCVIPRGRNEIEGCLGHQSGYWTHKKTVDGSESTELRSEFVLRCPPAEPQPATSKPTPETNSNQRSQGDAFSASDAKSSDSEDFLIKYSDIIIGQKPLQFTDLPPKASVDNTQAVGFVGTRLGPQWSLGHLPPDASGPQALAILNDGTLGSSQPHDYRTQDACRAMIESSICGAVNCPTIHGPDPTDQPKDLKGNSILHSGKLTAYDFSDEEEAHDSLSNQKPNIQGNYTEKFVRPVEETVQHELANRTSRRDTQAFMKLRATGGDRQDFTDLYSASGLSCTSMAIRLGLPTEEKSE